MKKQGKPVIFTRIRLGIQKTAIPRLTHSHGTADSFHHSDILQICGWGIILQIITCQIAVDHTVC